MEVHDIDCRLATITDLLHAAWYLQCIMSKTSRFRHTSLFNLYALRTLEARNTRPAPTRNTVSKQVWASRQVLQNDHLALPSRRLPARLYDPGKPISQLTALPLTANGKLDREGAARSGQPMPMPPAAMKSPRGRQRPPWPRIWAELLKLERIGRHDNFFHPCGHSLARHHPDRAHAAQGLLGRCGIHLRRPHPGSTGGCRRAGRAFGCRFHPTVSRPAGDDAEMLPLIELSQAEVDRIVAAIPGGAADIQDIYPLGPLQQGILFHHLMAGAGRSLSAGDHVRPFQSRERLERYLQAMQAVIDHGTTSCAPQFSGRGWPEPVQVVFRTAALPVEEVRLDEDAGDGG